MAAPTELLPCPFCRGELERDESISQTRHPRNDCIAKSIMFESGRQDCIAQWNRRASPPAAARDERDAMRAIELLREWQRDREQFAGAHRDGFATDVRLLFKRIDAALATPASAGEGEK